MSDNEHRDMEEEDEEQVPAQVADLAEASVPNSMKGVRACKRCGILKTIDQFIDNGCENCPFLEMVSICVENMQCAAAQERCLDFCCSRVFSDQFSSPFSLATD